MARQIDAPRNTRSRGTRARLLAAMRALLEEDGFEALTMGAVAERAGVTRKSVYLHFTSRSDMVTQLFDYVATEEGLVESQRPVWDAPDAVSALEEWARHLGRYHPRVLAVDRAVQQVRRCDPDAARHFQTVIARQQAAARRLAARLHDEHRLAPMWTVDSAADMIWALTSSEPIERLIVERQWTPQRLADHLVLVLRSTLVGDDPAGSGAVAAGTPEAGTAAAPARRAASGEPTQERK